MKNERKQLTNLIKMALELNIYNCKLLKKLYTDKENTKTFNLSIKQSKQALIKIDDIKHIEILRAIYGDVVGKVSGVLMLGGTMISSNAFDRFDKTEDGFKEFCDLQEQIKNDYIAKIKERQENAEAIRKAKELGKDVNFMFDPKDSKVKPVIVEK